jgi:hypothetical protein
MEPWMKWTGMNFWAAVIMWFRIPREERRVTVSAALVAMSVFAAFSESVWALSGYSGEGNPN